MTKPWILVLLASVLIIVVGAVLLGSNLGKVIKAGIENLGPKMTQATVTVSSVDLSPTSGSGSIHGLVIGNPAPYKEPFALRLSEVTLTIDPSSLVSDKIVIKSLKIINPKITLEGGFSDNNLTKLLANMDTFSGPVDPKAGAPEKGNPTTQKKLQVDEFLLSGAKVSVKLNILGLSAVRPTLTLPDIRLAQLGTGPEGVTPISLTRQIMGEIVAKTTSAITAQIGALGKSGLDKAANALKGATQGLKDVFKKK
ncbi:MAG: hypothetical protein EXS25_04710 [Pedosphaera sp.]|nr:hypothetical protein [Pedosphaera sp.]